MRIWLDPQKLNKYNLVPSDVISQIKVQNNQISGGQLGGMPQAADQQLNASIIVQTRLQTPEEFGKILLKFSKMVRKCCCVMSPASNLERKIIPPWRAITANLLPGSPSNWLPEQTPGYLAGSQRGAEPLISLFPRKSEDGLSLRHHAVYRNFYSGSF